MIASKDHYSTLNCERFADRETVRKNFYRLMLVHHPDKTEGEPSAQAQAMIAAWEVLGDEDEKTAYDSALRQAGQHQELLSYKFGWRVEKEGGAVVCPQCGEPSQVRAGETRVECDSCSAAIDLEAN